jgi:hypothetical protein
LFLLKVLEKFNKTPIQGETNDFQSFPTNLIELGFSFITAKLVKYESK